MLKDEGSVPGHFSGAVIVRFDHADACRVFDQVSFRITDVEPNAQTIVAGRERQAGNVTYKDLQPDPLAMGAVRLEQAVRRKNALSEHVIKAQADVKAVRY